MSKAEDLAKENKEADSHHKTRHLQAAQTEQKFEPRPIKTLEDRKPWNYSLTPLPQYSYLNTYHSNLIKPKPKS